MRAAPRRPAMAFTFAAFCYMLSLVLCAALIFFAIWHVSNRQRLLTLFSRPWPPPSPGPLKCHFTFSTSRVWTDRRPAAAHPRLDPLPPPGCPGAGDGSEHPEAGAPSVPSYWRRAEGPPGGGAGHPRQGLALCPRPRDERLQPQQPSPHFPCPLLSCPRGGEGEAPPWARQLVK